MHICGASWSSGLTRFYVEAMPRVGGSHPNPSSFFGPNQVKEAFLQRRSVRARIVARNEEMREHGNGNVEERPAGGSGMEKMKKGDGYDNVLKCQRRQQ